MYVLGVDLGTTYSAAAVWRDGRAEIASLGSRAAAIPSVVFLREDETVLTGESREPARADRAAPGGAGVQAPARRHHADHAGWRALLGRGADGRLLRPVVDEVTQPRRRPPRRRSASPTRPTGVRTRWTCCTRRSGWPTSTCRSPSPPSRRRRPSSTPAASGSTPVRWSPSTTSAAARSTPPCSARPPPGFEILGQPEGIERLGGIDFDAAVFAHVLQPLGGKLDELDEDDPPAIAAVARLREECVAGQGGALLRHRRRPSRCSCPTSRPRCG